METRILFRRSARSRWMPWAAVLGISLGLVACRADVPSAAEGEGEGGKAVGAIEPNSLKETSGLVVSRLHDDVIWVHNDGDRRRLFALTTNGRELLDVRLENLIHDMEDIAIGPGPRGERSYLYLGDIGDNQSNRAEIQILGFSEPANLATGGATSERVDVQADTFRLRYPDEPHDAEALLVDPVDSLLLVVTKEKRSAAIYGISLADLSTTSTQTLTRLTTVDFEKVSAGDISADGKTLILRREETGRLWTRGEHQTVAEMLLTRPRQIPVRSPQQAENGEAIGITPDNQAYLTVSEGKNEVIWRFEL